MKSYANIDIHVVHRTCRRLQEWQEDHRQVGVYPNFVMAEKDASERVERQDFICKLKMVCECCEEVIYLGADV